MPQIKEMLSEDNLKRKIAFCCKCNKLIYLNTTTCDCGVSEGYIMRDVYLEISLPSTWRIIDNE